MRHSAPPGLWVRDQPHPGEVELTLHSRITVGDPHRALPPPEPAPLGREPVQCAIRHLHTQAGQFAVDVGQLQIVLDPVANLYLLRNQTVPRLTVPGLPRRAHRGDHRADQLIRQLTFTAAAQQAGNLRSLHITAGGLAIHPGPLRRRAQTVSRQPAAQHLSNLVHPHLPERHQQPPRHDKP